LPAWPVGSSDRPARRSDYLKAETARCDRNSQGGASCYELNVARVAIAGSEKSDDSESGARSKGDWIVDRGTKYASASVLFLPAANCPTEFFSLIGSRRWKT